MKKWEGISFLPSLEGEEMIVEAITIEGTGLCVHQLKTKSGQDCCGWRVSQISSGSMLGTVLASKAAAKRYLQLVVRAYGNVGTMTGDEIREAVASAATEPWRITARVREEAKVRFTSRAITLAGGHSTKAMCAEGYCYLKRDGKYWISNSSGWVISSGIKRARQARIAIVSLVYASTKAQQNLDYDGIPLAQARGIIAEEIADEIPV